MAPLPIRCWSHGVLVALVSSCLASCASSSAEIYSPGRITNGSQFVIVVSTDPINVAPVIAGELKESGFAVAVRPRDRQREQSSRPSQTPKSRTGSAFFISESGHLATNYHVVQGADSVTLALASGETCSARVEKTDPNNDLAILKAVNRCPATSWLRLGSYADVRVGDEILVIGYPLTAYLGTEARVTDGIVSSNSGLRGDPTRFQISAPIQPGNSGGPIVNQRFEVVGIATEKLSDAVAVTETGSIPQNVNFGVKADYASLLFEKNDGTSASLSSAIEATALVLVGEADVSQLRAANPSGMNTEHIEVRFTYSYYFDVFHYTLTALSIDLGDPRSGDLIGQATHAGDSVSGYQSIVRNAIRNLLEKTSIP